MRLAAATDIALLNHWRTKGDPAAFAVLVDRHAAMVHSASLRVVGNRALAQEIAQDSFLKLTQLENFDGASLGGWLHRVATNRAIDLAKSESRRHARDTAFETSRDAPPSPESAAILAEIDAALNALPEDLRELIVLHYLEGVTYKEIARRVGTSRATVTRKIQHALDQLREHLGARGVAAGVAVLASALASARAEAVPTVLVGTLRKLALRAPSTQASPVPAMSATFPIAIAVTVSIAVLAIIAAVLGPRLRATTLRPEPSSAIPLARAATPQAPVPRPSSALADDPPPIQLAAQVEPSTAAPATSGPTTQLRCVDVEGKPVDGAEVYLVRREAVRFVAKADDEIAQVLGPFTSDADGRITVPEIKGPKDDTRVYYQGFARVPGKLVGGWLRYPGFPGRANWDEITMVSSQTIRGRVNVPRGLNVQSVTVKLMSISTGNPRSVGGFSNASKFREQAIPPLPAQHPDPQGKFSFSDIPTSGNFSLSAVAADLAEAQVSSVTHDMGAEIVIEMKPESRLRGSVFYGPSGAPAIGVPVFAHPRGEPASGITNTSPFVALTDGSGRFTITGLPPTVYNVMTPAHADWIAPVVGNTRVGAGEEGGPIELKLEHGGFVEGFVRDAETKAPIRLADFAVLNPDNDAGWNVAIAFGSTDENGHYSIRLPVGSSRLYFSKVPAGYSYPNDQGTRHVAIDPNQREPVKYDFTLSAAAPIQDVGKTIVSGRTVDKSGKPVSDVPIFDDEDRGTGPGEMTRGLVGRSGKDGIFSVEIIAAGKHKIGIGGGNGIPGKATTIRFSYSESKELRPRKGETIDLGKFVVEEYFGNLGGTVVDENGRPVPRVLMDLYADLPGFRGAMVVTDDTGAFAFKLVPQGKFKLYARPNQLTRPPNEPPIPYVQTEADVASGYDYEIVLKKKPEGTAETEP